MMLSLGLSISDGRHEFPGVIYDMVTLHNEANRKESKKETEEDEWQL